MDLGTMSIIPQGIKDMLKQIVQLLQHHPLVQNISIDQVARSLELIIYQSASSKEKYWTGSLAQKLHAAVTAENCKVPEEGNGDQVSDYLVCILAPGAGKGHSWLAIVGTDDSLQSDPSKQVL